ncbi:MAG TPA: DUF1698 domain-containing protein [Candidatus Binataceae bacterium]|jgi:tRNA (mo5U34)-methyltransferase|nr:DUF1698 domain-containing protein [Candidatus Binataceae bacterium]
MTADEIRAGARRLEPWFHQIDLGHGILTKTRPVGNEPIDHPARTWQIIKPCLPEDLQGRSVLDVGCNAGFYAIEAKRRNARRVVGIDSQRLHIRQARFAASVLGLDIEYQRISVYNLNAQQFGKFDLTLALGLIYHCKHVLLALERLFQVTGGTMILESAVFPPQRLFESFSDSSGIGRRFHGLAYVENDPTSREAVYNWFVPTVDCLKAMLSDVGFVDIEVASEAHGRAVIVCRRPAADLDSLTMPQQLAAQLSLAKGPEQCGCSASLHFTIGALNTGNSTWRERGDSDGKGAVRLGVHLYDQSGEEIIYDYAGVPITQPVAPGGKLELEFSIPAPPEPGKYQLEFDMVSDYLTWFEDAGSTIPLVHWIEVR